MTLAKPVLFTDRQAQRIEKAVRAVERDERNQRPNPHPSYRASAIIAGVVIGSVAFAPNRWRYTVVYTQPPVEWDTASKRWKAIGRPMKSSACYAYNQYEATNTATQFGHGTPVSQGSGTLTPSAIPNDEPVMLALRVGEEDGFPVFEFYAVNPVTAGCNP